VEIFGGEFSQSIVILWVPTCFQELKAVHKAIQVDCEALA